MYQFKTYREEEIFERSLITSLEAFKKAKSHKQKETVKNALYWLRLAQANYKTEDADSYLVYVWLNTLYDEKLWEFEESDLQFFRK